MEIKKTDSQLLLAWKNGNVKAFDLLYSRHADALYLFLNGSLRNRDWAEEALQSLFVGMFEKPQLYITAKDFRGYLFQSAVNASAAILRRELRDRKNTHQFHLAFKGNLWNKPERESHIFADEESRNALTQALLKLQDKDREIVLLHIYGNFSFTQIESITGIPSSTAHDRFQMSLKTLKQELKHLYPGE